MHLFPFAAPQTFVELLYSPTPHFHSVRKFLGNIRAIDDPKLSLHRLLLKAHLSDNTLVQDALCVIEKLYLIIISSVWLT